MPATMTTRAYQPADEAAVWALLERALAAGDLPRMGHHDIGAIRDRLAIDAGSRLVAVEGERVVGLVVLSMQHLLVDRDARRRGHGRRLVEAALAMLASRGERFLDLYVPPGTAAATSFAQASGFAPHASLWQMRLDSDAVIAAPSFPPGVVTRPLRVGEDEEQFVELFNRAFAAHPTPLSVPLDTLRHVHALPSFDPSAFLVALDGCDGRTMAGFCRTRLDGDVGEVVLVGVLPERRGVGLGRALLAWGVQHLRQRGAAEIMLSVEALNTTALGLYEQVGFRRVQEWPRWRRLV